MNRIKQDDSGFPPHFEAMVGKSILKAIDSDPNWTANADLQDGLADHRLEVRRKPAVVLLDAIHRAPLFLNGRGSCITEL
jgi:hypothetical protein